MPISLYHLAAEGMWMQDALRESEGELTPELEARFDALLLHGADKLEAAAMVVRELEVACRACENEMRWFQERRDSYQKQVDSLKARMLGAVDVAFSGKIKTEKFTIYGQNSGERTSFEVSPDADLVEIANECPKAVRTSYELNKLNLQLMASVGEKMPASITQVTLPGKRSLRIK